MAESAVNDTLNPISELSREEILKQIFGDIGEIIDGK